MKAVWIPMLALLLCTGVMAAVTCVDLTAKDDVWKSAVIGSQAGDMQPQLERTRKITHTGDGSLMICKECDSSARQAGIWTRTVAVEPQHRYRLTAIVLLKKVSGDGAFIEMDGTRCTPVVSEGRPLDKWVPLSIEIKTRPGQTSADVSVGMLPGKGKCWFDDVKVEDLGAE